ncbi:FecCD family ABC transporter permease [Rhizobium sp. YIM 134829]|uniref:FecCD family ABC transporter permease n=1 Tax=Rhizobium sp. YIM 134829 TaxID=3390453 RepID=UPI0039795B65
MIADPANLERFVGLRRRFLRQQRRAITLLLALLVVGFLVTLSVGRSVTPPLDVIRVLLGETVPGAGFTVGQLRLPRAVVSVLAGLCFGLGGASFQLMLRNPLASPDIIGVTSGAGAAAVVAIVVFSMRGPEVSIIAIAGGLTTAVLVYGLSLQNGASGTRLILVGIGVSAMLQSMIALVLQSSPAWNLQEALRWLTGSVNGASLDQAVPLLVALILFGGLLLSRTRDLEALRLGDEVAASLGVRTGLTRVLVMLAAVALIASATAATGPIAFVAFLSGPIAARILHNRGSLLPGAALAGAGLVLIADFIGQHGLPNRYPVGVVTGVLGAPYLVFLIVRANRTGG